jgi:thiol-disulfide isomerase/thioredoxin
MGLLLLIARIMLAAVFATAGAAKLTNLKASRKAVDDFGVPAWLSHPIGSALPFAELTVAISLVSVRSAWWGGVGALVLLAAFIAAIAVNLALGRKPDCQCFGQIQSKPIGWPTLARNGALAALAALVVWAGPAQTSVIDVMVGLSGPQAVVAAVVVIVLAAIAGQTWLIFHLFKQHGRLLLRIDELEKRFAAAPAATQRPPAPAAQGLPLGAPAPTFELPTLAGQSLALDILHSSKPAVLIFSDPNCGPCTALLPEIGRWQRDYGEKVRIALVSRGSEKANRSKVKPHGVRDVLLQTDREVAELYQANGTPAAVLVQPDGSIGSRVASGSEAITTLVATAAGVPIPTATASGGNGRGKILPMPMTAHSGLPIGEAAPSITLPDLTGRSVSLSDFKGRKTLVLFWNPGCGFCQRLLPDLKAWEENRSNGAPELLVISTGAAEANEKMGLRSPVLVDGDFNTARQFRGGGTPSGVLVDSEGNIASELAIGGSAVLALVGVTQSKRAAKPDQKAGDKTVAAHVH